MSKRTSPAEPAAYERTATSNDESIPNTGSDDIDINTSESDSESMEGESSLKKESGDLFRNEESGIGEIASESDSESDSRLSVEDVFEGEEERCETADNNITCRTSTYRTGDTQSLTEAMDADNTCKSSDGVSEAKDEQDGTENESKTFFNAEQSGEEYPQSHKKVLKMKSKKLKKKFTEGVLEIDDEQGATGNESKSSGKAAQNIKVSALSPQSPTEALEALNISDAPSSSKTKSTRRQPNSMQAMNDILNSPYRTRLKARLMGERDSCDP